MGETQNMKKKQTRQSKKRFDKHLTFTVFLFTTLVFIIGILMGNFFSDKKFSLLEENYEEMRISSLSIDVQNLILQENPCEVMNLTTLTEELYDFSSKLSHLENTFGWDDRRVMTSKERFSLLELRHWMLVKGSMERCGTKKTLILYFYSNKGDCSKCERQGTVLTNLRRKNEDILVYHFDINIDNCSIV